MKVIKAPDTAWSKRVECSSCGAELELEKGDLKAHHYPGDFREPSYDAWRASCPFCNRVIEIPGKDIPKAVQLEIKDGKSFGPGGFRR